MSEITELLELSKRAASGAALRLLDDRARNHRTYVHSINLPREIKAAADEALERDILGALAPTGLSILSEESGYLPGDGASPFTFIVDPLDGTFNFVKNLGPSAVCIGLWRDRAPVFGVIYSLAERELSWGGPALGAWREGEPLTVSNTAERSRAAICTGFPARFDVADEAAVRDFWQTVQPFAKVRMIGSAAMSLLRVASGAADVYAEKRIMFWDVAAGVAIVEGAGGRSRLDAGPSEHCLDVYASNPHLLPAPSRRVGVPRRD